MKRHKEEVIYKMLERKLSKSGNETRYAVFERERNDFISFYVGSNDLKQELGVLREGEKCDILFELQNQRGFTNPVLVGVERIENR